MIRSFADKHLETFWLGGTSRHIPATIQRTLWRKLLVMQGAKSLEVLRQPPANRLEALVGDLAGWHSIRVNDQWRLVFRWKDEGVHDLKLMDYH